MRCVLVDGRSPRTGHQASRLHRLRESLSMLQRFCEDVPWQRIRVKLLGDLSTYR